jgi:hypothetical protein
MVIRMVKEEEKATIERVREVRSKATESLIAYLETFRPPESMGDSKHALMGPVGKLLSRITSTGDINWEATKGYVLSIHKNQQAPRGVSADAAERLDKAIEVLAELRGLLPPTKWLKTVEDIDDEVFFGLYKAKLVGQRRGVQKLFHKWLKETYSLEEINELLLEENQYGAIEAIEDPFSLPPELSEIRERFWEDRKKKKAKEE